MPRISRHQMFMEMAYVAGKRSTCARLNVGALLVHGIRVIAIGYNGQAPGAPHCDRVCTPGGCNTIHAEVNVLDPCRGDRGFDRSLYVTHAPCRECARVIAQSRVKDVYFSEPYRHTDGLEYLYDHNIRVHRVLPAGHVIEWSKQELVATA